jgi:hypothetical protein
MFMYVFKNSLIKSRKIKFLKCNFVLKLFFDNLVSLFSILRTRYSTLCTYKMILSFPDIRFRKLCCNSDQLAFRLFSLLHGKRINSRWQPSHVQNGERGKGVKWTTTTTTTRRWCGEDLFFMNKLSHKIHTHTHTHTHTLIPPKMKWPEIKYNCFEVNILVIKIYYREDELDCLIGSFREKFCQLNDKKYWFCCVG